MESQFVTFNKSDKQFIPYLEGTFSKDLRALPEQSLNVNTKKEQVTFRLLKISDIKRPNIFVLLFKLFRLEWLSLTMGPVLATYSYLWINKISINHFSAGLAIIAVVFFHAAVFAINDYKDHIVGVDRLSLHGGSQVIQKGWLTAYQVRKLGMCLFAFGVVIGAYLIIQQPIFLMSVGALTALCVLGYSFYGQGLKYLGYGEFVSFFCFGPMLTYGFSRAASFYHSLEVIGLGLGFGFIAVIIFLSRQLENILSDSKIGINSLAIRLGFDKSKRVIEIGILLIPGILIFSLLVTTKNLLVVICLLPMCYFSIRLYLHFTQVNSSLSSKINDFRLRVADLHVIYSTLLVMFIWILK